jgi:uncharacterized phage protein (TIGR01671 family)
MREIKFRAWDKKHQKMIGPFDMRDISNDWGGDCADFYIPYPEGTNERYDEGPWMQYTGRHNRDGKEVYEGDILDGHGLGRLVVKFGEWDDGGQYEDHHSGVGWYLENQRGEVFGLNYIDLYKNHPVIGNVWENPELLKEKE